jgi:hypothetical protein
MSIAMSMVEKADEPEEDSAGTERRRGDWK